MLDFGCGHGALSLEIASSGAERVVGIDIEKQNIDFANENLKIEFNYRGVEQSGSSSGS